LDKVVFLPLLHVRQHGVGQVDIRHFASGFIRFRVFVGVVVLGKTTVRRPNHHLAGVRADFKQFVMGLHVTPLQPAPLRNG
jgi:hypothetical protein